MGHKPIEGSNPFVSAIILVEVIALLNFFTGFWAVWYSGARDSYDERDRLETINDPATGATIMAYDADSNMTRMTDALSETTEFAYDAVERLLSSVDAKGQLRAFAYDARDNITAITDARANVSLITYDEIDRPRSRSNPNSETWQLETASLADSLGGMTGYGYDAVDRLTRVMTPQGDNFDTNYDPAGRTLGRVAPQCV